MRLLRLYLIGASIALGACTVMVTNGALHVPERTLPAAQTAESLARRTDSTWMDLQVRSADGEALHGWLFTPRVPIGAAVIALHGVADTRLGMLAHAEFLLRNGFTVLVPDSRGHGASGDAAITYGVREATDIRHWSDRLLEDRRLLRLYGMGQSMGAAILLESLKTEPRWRAIVADSPFATFEEISYERLQQVTGLPQIAFWPIVRLGFLYARLAYRDGFAAGFSGRGYPIDKGSGPAHPRCCGHQYSSPSLSTIARPQSVSDLAVAGSGRRTCLLAGG